MSAQVFKGLGRGKTPQIPRSSSPSPELSRANSVGELLSAAFAGVESYIKNACPGALSGSLCFRELGTRAGAADLVEHFLALETRIDQAVLTKAELDTVRDLVGRWEVLTKAIIHAIAVARSQNAELI